MDQRSFDVASYPDRPRVITRIRIDTDAQTSYFHKTYDNGCVDIYVRKNVGRNGISMCFKAPITQELWDQIVPLYSARLIEEASESSFV